MSGSSRSRPKAAAPHPVKLGDVHRLDHLARIGHAVGNDQMARFPFRLANRPMG